MSVVVVLETPQTLALQRLADTTTSIDQFQIRKIQSSNQNGKCSKMAVFLHVCKKIRKKKSLALYSLTGGLPDKCKKKRP